MPDTTEGTRGLLRMAPFVLGLCLLSLSNAQVRNWSNFDSIVLDYGPPLFPPASLFQEGEICENFEPDYTWPGSQLRPLSSIIVPYTLSTKPVLDNSECVNAIPFVSQVLTGNRTAQEISRMIAKDPFRVYNFRNELCPRCLPNLDGVTNEAQLTALLETIPDNATKALAQVLYNKHAYRSVPRRYKPVLTFPVWLSARLVGSVAGILLREAMDYDWMPYAETYSEKIICENVPFVMFERWGRFERPYSSASRVELEENRIGYSGYSGLYIHQWVSEMYPQATSWASLLKSPEILNLFTPSGYLPCTAFFPSWGNFTNETLWTSPPCNYSRLESLYDWYAPPWCLPFETVGRLHCKEVLFPAYGWDAGYFEALIYNLQLNLTLVYLGVAHWKAASKYYKTARRPVIFYVAEPDPMSLDAVPIQFPRSTPECVASWVSELPEGNPGLTCDYEVSNLRKIAASRLLSNEPDLRHFFHSMTISSSQLNRMMSLTSSTGVQDVACEWVKNNSLIWADWIRNTLPVVDLESVIAAERRAQNIRIGWIVGTVLGASLLVGLVIALWLRIRIAARTKNAPRQVPFALLFTDVQSSTKLWEEYRNSMAEAMEIHHSVIRRLIALSNAYEVKTIGDAFMITAASMKDAILLAVSIQRELQNAQWPEWLNVVGVSTNDPYEALALDTRAQKNMRHKFNGLRVRIGVHWCTEANAKFDLTTQRYDYYGHDVNLSSRVEGAGEGGQIMTTEAAFKEYLREEASEDAPVSGNPMVSGESEELTDTAGQSADLSTHFITDMDASISLHDEHAQLKGIQGTTALYSVIPLDLAANGRLFPAKETADAGRVTPEARRTSLSKYGNAFAEEEKLRIDFRTVGMALGAILDSNPAMANRVTENALDAILARHKDFLYTEVHSEEGSPQQISDWAIRQQEDGASYLIKKQRLHRFLVIISQGVRKEAITSATVSEMLLV